MAKETIRQDGELSSTIEGEYTHLIDVQELEIEEVQLAPAPIEPVALLAVQGGCKPDCSLMELNQAIRVIQQYHDLQRARQAKIKARLDMISTMH